jgi:hypothetical protein
LTNAISSCPKLETGSANSTASVVSVLKPDGYFVILLEMLPTELYELLRQLQGSGIVSSLVLTGIPPTSPLQINISLVPETHPPPTLSINATTHCPELETGSVISTASVVSVLKPDGYFVILLEMLPTELCELLRQLQGSGIVSSLVLTGIPPTSPLQTNVLPKATKVAPGVVKTPEATEPPDLTTEPPWPHQGCKPKRVWRPPTLHVGRIGRHRNRDAG